MLLQDAATSNFLSWCTARGIESSLQVQGSHPHRYVSCEKDLQPDNNGNNKSNNRVPLVRVPLESCLTADSQTALADRLMLEKMLGNDSLFAPYLEMLPPSPFDDPTSSLLDMPRFWSDDRLTSISNFDGGQLEERLEATQYTDEEKLVDEWALACVKTRSNFLDDGTYAMTPLLDMINHDPTITTKAQVLGRKKKDNNKGFGKSNTPEDDNNDVVELPYGPVLELSVLDHSFRAGEEVFMSYGDMTNLDTLCDYGFVAENNPCNVECLDVRLILSPNPVKVAVLSDGTIAPETLAQLRRMLATPEELEGKKKDQLDDFLEPLSDNNELESLAFLATELDMSSKDARRGALEAATVREDKVVTAYLAARAKTFEQAIEKIKEQYPDLEY